MEDGDVFKRRNNMSPMNLDGLRSDLKRLVNILIDDFMVFSRLLKQAHDLSAWKEWGHVSWLEYLSTELNMSNVQANDYLKVLRIATDNNLSDNEVKAFGLSAVRNLDRLESEIRTKALVLLRAGDFCGFKALLKPPKTPVTTCRKRIAFDSIEDYREFRRLAEFSASIQGGVSLGSAALSALRSEVAAMREAAREHMKTAMNR
jgi:hypothetical protein